MYAAIIGLIPFLPAFAGFTVPVVYLTTRRRIVVMAYTAIVMAIATFLSFIVMLETYSSTRPLVFRAGGWPAPIGIIYVVDKFTGLVGFISTVILLCIAVYSVSYIVDEAYPWYSVLLLGSASGILGVTYTGDMFNLFVMLEVTGVSAYALVMYYRNRAISIISGLKYAFIGSLGTTLYLLAMGLVYSIYGTLNFIDFSFKLINVENQLGVLSYGVVMTLALWAFSIKSGVFPNHFWLPDAHPAAPTPISALLSGLVVNTGVMGLYKFLYIASWSAEMSVLERVRDFISLVAVITGCLSAVLGALLMNIQRDVKRLIAYSTVMNLGFLFMGLGCISLSGLRATILYLITHSLAKATLFLSTGIFIKATGSRILEELSGMGMRYPLAGLTFTISTLTLAGIPPLPGFLSKLLLYEALFTYNIVLALTMIIASAIGLLAYMKLLYIVVFGAPIKPLREIDMKTAYVSITALSIFIITVGVVFLLYPEITKMVLDSAAEQSTLGIVDYVEYVKNTFLKP